MTRDCQKPHDPPHTEDKALGKSSKERKKKREQRKKIRKKPKQKKVMKKEKKTVTVLAMHMKCAKRKYGPERKTQRKGGARRKGSSSYHMNRSFITKKTQRERERGHSTNEQRSEVEKKSQREGT
jgi:hypothetical protein